MHVLLDENLNWRLVWMEKRSPVVVCIRFVCGMQGQGHRIRTLKAPPFEVVAEVIILEKHNIR